MNNKIKQMLVLLSMLTLLIVAFAGCELQHTHSFGDWEYNSNNHYKFCDCGETWGDSKHELANGICSVCGYNQVQSHTHLFDQQVTTDAFFKTVATCTAKATYFYSCECGEKGSETFEVGEKINHLFETYINNEDATFTTNSTETATCNYGCGATDTREIINSKLPHPHGQILIMESISGDSNVLKNLLKDSFKVNVINIVTASYSQLPKSVDDLRQYDQIIFNNISNENLDIADQTLYGGDYPNPQQNDPKFESYQGRMISMIYSFVYDYGGGLFTVGGNKTDGTPNAYTRVDLKNSIYQGMLPVNAIEYTPPVGVMFIIDRSGSMKLTDNSTGMTYLDLAKVGAASCLSSLTERDYVGIMTLSSESSTVIDLTSLIYKDKIMTAIDSIYAGGGTLFTPAIDKAGYLLAQLNVAKRHIILVTDGVPGESESDYLPLVEKYYKNDGTTISVVKMGRAGATESTKMQNICNAAGGSEKGSNYYVVTNPELLPQQMRAEVKNITDMVVNNDWVMKAFNPTMLNLSSPLVAGFNKLNGTTNQMTATLGGFYGGIAKTNTEQILVGEYNIPLYAQWGFGAGMVGSFMSDLKGTTGSWSYDFLTDKDGKQFVINVVANLMPTYCLRTDDYQNTDSTNCDMDQLKVKEYYIIETEGAEKILTGFAGDKAQLIIATIPNGVTRIGESAFADCVNLLKITIPDTVTSIGEWVFVNCSSLTNITIPDSVMSIGEYAFRGCSSLTSVYYMGTASEWSKIRIYYNNNELINATIYYYSQTEPTESGNYWHFATDGKTPIVWKKEN